MRAVSLGCGEKDKNEKIRVSDPHNQKANSDCDDNIMTRNRTYQRKGRGLVTFILCCWPTGAAGH